MVCVWIGAARTVCAYRIRTRAHGAQAEGSCPHHMAHVWTGAARTVCAHRTRTRALGHAEPGRRGPVRTARCTPRPGALTPRPG
ncbi:hypothetical protein GCM10010287_09560 [Streptomyces variabilis]|uniref:Uncharacterized protein n=1 Tax=Streptomyces variabilis TaxID=67372 RepID=A0ABQ2TS78_9ACTN|nr:hypothetical protein GCM10010265_16440 [Streptomyces griseoincarnatus]GGT39002.1 hypothetical protein GCM10010287_09560 [Streptomyces variabilis]